MMNPYAHCSFFQFVGLFIKRMFSFMQPHYSMAADELQILVLSLISVCCALVGVFLIHRKMTMLANALSHTVIFGIVITFLILKKSFLHFDPSLNFKALFIASFITALLTALIAELISHYSSLEKEASIGLVFTTFFALGILLLTLFSKNGHIGMDMIMGNVDALHPQDLRSMLGLFAIVLPCILLFYRGLTLSTFDPIFAKLQGFSPKLFNYLILFLLALSSIGAFRAVGVVLVLAFFIVPALFAQLFAKSIKSQLALACLMGMLSSFMGVALSRHLLFVHELPLSTGGVTVVVLYFNYFFSYACKKGTLVAYTLYQKMKITKKELNWLK